MTTSAALNLRRLGLAIEAVCLLGVLSLARQPFPVEPRRVLGIELHYVLGAGIAVGFALWLTGTISYYVSQRKAKSG